MDKIYPSPQLPRITVIAPKSLKNWLKRYAKKNNTSVSQIVLRLLKEFKEDNK